MVTEIPLHPYQQEAKQAVIEAYHLRDKTRMVVSMPTGAGKTRTAISICRDLLHQTDYALFLVPFIDLVEQTQKSFLEWYPSEQIGIIQGERYNHLGRWITIASKDTLDEPARLDMLMSATGKPFSLVFVDECRLAVAEGYRELLARVTNVSSVVIGLDATPYREDRQSLLKVFPDGLISNVDMFDLMAQGYLAYPRIYNRPTNLDLSETDLTGLYTTTEEISEGLQSRLERSNRYEIGYATWKQLGQGKRTVFFAQNTKDAYGWEKYLTEKGVPCVVVTGKTPSYKRTEYYAALARNELVIIFFNVGTTGLDIPSIECIVLGRMTDNRGLITQIIGRGTRLCTEIGKDSFIVINLTGKNFMLFSYDFLIGRVDDEEIDVKQALQERLVEKEKEKKKQPTQKEEDEDERQVYEIGVRIKELQVHAYNAFTGTGWKGDLLSGSYTKSCGSYGTLIAERTFTGYSLLHLSPSGRKTTLSREDLSAEHAMARGTAHIERLKEREKMNDGTSANLQLPITQGQLRMLTNRRVLILPPGTPLLQSDYKALERLLREHGSAFPTVNGAKCRIAHSYGQNIILTNNQTRKGENEKKQVS